MSKTSRPASMSCNKSCLYWIGYWELHLLSISWSFWTDFGNDHSVIKNSANVIFLVFEDGFICSKLLQQICLVALDRAVPDNGLDLFQCLNLWLFFFVIYTILCKRCQMKALALLQDVSVLMKIRDKLCILLVLTANLSALQMPLFSCFTLHWSLTVRFSGV